MTFMYLGKDAFPIVTVMGFFFFGGIIYIL